MISLIEQERQQKNEKNNKNNNTKKTVKNITVTIHLLSGRNVFLTVYSVFKISPFFALVHS